MAIKDEVQDILEKAGACMENGHFQLKSGMHTDSYINVRLALSDREYASFLGEALAQKFKDDHIDAVIGFTYGGTKLARNVAQALGARSVLAKRFRTLTSFSEGHHIKQDESVLIVDEGVTTGNSIRSVIRFVRDKTGGRIKGVGTIIDRSEKELDFGVKTECLKKIEMNLWVPHFCPLCKQGKPLTIIDSPEENPFQIRFLVPKELYRRLYPTVREVLREWGEERLLREIESYENPLYELPGRKYERVAVLGSFKNFAEIERIARDVAALEFYGVTSKLIYDPNSAERREWTHYEYESMNDFLRRMIYCCQYVIAGYTIEGGQLIETTWCSQSNKPTLGLVQVRPWKFKSRESCRYLSRHKRRNIVSCNGFSAYKSSEKVVGGWLCQRVEEGEDSRECPFLSADLSKMILDFFATSSTMYLVGYDPEESLVDIVGNFLGNKGILDLEKVP